MLSVLTKDEAVRLVREKTENLKPEVEIVSLSDSLGRTLAQNIVAEENIPSFNRTTVDGYALNASDTFGASNSMPAQLNIVGEILMGENADFSLKSGQCAKISTGGMLPEGANCAVMVEHTDEVQGLCLIYKSAAPYENVTKKGDDISEGALAIKKGTLITAAQIGVLSALGIEKVPVFKKCVIAIISTGDEIVSGKPEPGQIRDINTFLLSAKAKEKGCEVLCYGAVKDEKSAIKSAVEDCLKKADAVIISGGSSAGTRDMTVNIIDELGEVFFHGIAMKPGKPTIFGIAEGKPVFGLPGHPLAAYFVFRLIVNEYISGIMNMPELTAKKSAVLALNIPSNHGREEYLCIKYNENNEVVPIHTKSGIISVLSEAQGFIKISRNTEGLFKGTTVEIYEL